MSGFLHRDHTITPTWSARDATGRKIVCAAAVGTPVKALVRPCQLQGGDDGTIRLPSNSAANPLEMAKARSALSLAAFVSQNMSAPIADKIAIASALTRELATIHACHILHGRICADSIRIDPAAHTAQILDFTGAVALAAGAGLADMALAHERLAFMLPIAPESLGRSGRPIDHRIDLYALGCTLYHFFAGRPVFCMDDEVALLHAHLAKLPVPLRDVANVPPLVSDIVMSLLKKQAEERYQRADNAAADLDACRAATNGAGGVKPPVLRLKTPRSALADGDVLCGRDSQQQQLAGALTAARQGRPQRLLVTGAPGVGKSILCRHFAEEVARGGGRAAFGKFEQSHANAPYLGISRCLENLTDRLLKEPADVTGNLARDLVETLNENLAILGDLVPNLKDLAGPWAPAAALSGFGARDRLAQSVLGFLKAVASCDRPVVLFLDDLQWADSASLDLLRRIADDLDGSVMLVGTCRVERDSRHLLDRAVVALTSKQAEPRRCELIALTRSDVEDLLLAVFGPKRHQLEAASLVFAKTLGSPLFVCQLLNGIGDDAMLDPSVPWDLARIAAIDGASDVADFLSLRIVSLDAASRNVLATGACFGMSFRREQLADLTGIDEHRLAHCLAQLVADGFVASVADVYVFVHDRVREAAYRLADEREAIHRTIARQLLETQDGRDVHAFAIVGHLRAAGDLDADPELETGYRLTAHRAARRAHAGAAFGLAREYAEIALGDGATDRWTADYEAMAATLLVKVESTVLQNDHERFDAEYDADRAKLHRDEDRLSLALIRVLSFDARARFADALAEGLGILRQFGIDLPLERDRQREALAHEVAAFERAMAGRSPDMLADLPPLADPRVATTMQILFRLAPSANNTMMPELFALMAVRNLRLMLQHGRDMLASGITMTFAFALAGITGDLDLADGYARAAMVMDGREGRRTPASITFVYSYFFSHWLHPLGASPTINLDGMRTGYEMGDLQFGCFHAAAYVMHLAALGAPLPDVIQAGRAHDLLIAGRIHVSSFHCRLEVAFAEALIGITAAPTSLTKDRVTDVADVLREADALVPSERGFLCARHLQLAYFHQAFDAAAAFAAAARDVFPAIERNFIAADVITFSLLTDLAAERPRTARFDEDLARLRGWSQTNPANFACRHDLVLAEIARGDGRPTEAIGFYVQALAAAKQHGFVHMAALTSERAGRFFMDLGDRIAGVAYLREASDLYGQWGARTKVAALLDDIPGPQNTAGQPQDAGRARDLAIDFEAVLAAARSISAEIDLHRLLQKIMASAQEVSGATYGALVLAHEAGQFVEIVSRHGERVVVCEALAEPVGSSPLVPRSVIAHVGRERATLVVHNAAGSDFAKDPYVRANPVVSMLCVPLEGRGRLDGFIYLENSLTAGAFHPRSAEALQVLAAQAAGALANARLVALLDRARADLADANEHLERKIEVRTHELAEARNLALEKAAEADQASRSERNANEAKSHLLSVVSHEIRTPMNGILGMLQLLDRERLEDRERRQIELAQQSGLALVKLIDGILDYTRLELGTAEPVHESFGLRDLVKTAVEIFRPTAEAKGVRLDVGIEAPPGALLHGDASGIRRVIINLVGNAVKFTARGSVSVSAGLSARDGTPAANLRLSVRDTGIGISPEMQVRIFEEFVQADVTVARRYGGTGLGLAISRRIIALLDGTITLDSVPGRGSTFSADIPVDVVGATAAVPQAHQTASQMADEPLSILVVDDDAINREVAAGLLERLGHTVVAAEGCEAAIMAVQCCAFDAVFLDLHMPEVDGIETARRIQLAIGLEPCPPMILLTADMTQPSRQRCLAAGITRILPKPLRLDALANMLAGLEASAPPDVCPSSPDAAVHPTLFAERCDMLGLPQMVRLIRRYHQTSRATIEAIEAAAAISDRRSVVRLAHRLRSASGSLQFAEMEDAAHRLEQAAASDSSPLDGPIVQLKSARGRLFVVAMREIRALRSRAMPEPVDAGRQVPRSMSTPSR